MWDGVVSHGVGVAHSDVMAGRALAKFRYRDSNPGILRERQVC